MARCAVSIRRWATVILDFASSGQLLDLAVALVISNAFTKTIEALVDNLLTPILGFIFDGINIADLQAKLQSKRWPNKVPVILAYGKFLQQLIYFAVIAILLSLIITIANKIYTSRKRNQINAEPLPTRQELILMEHTNLLQAIAQSVKK